MELLNTLLGLMVNNSPFVLDAVFLILIGYLVWERSQYNKIIKRQSIALETLSKNYNDDIRVIVDRYHKGNIELTQALNEIKTVLAAMIRNV